MKINSDDWKIIQTSKNEVFEPLKESINYLFQETKVPAFYINLKKVPSNSIFGKWLSKPQLIRNITAIYSAKMDQHYYSNMVLNNAYDGFIYIDKSNPKNKYK